MIEIAFSPSFKRAYRKRISTNPNADSRFWEKVEVFKLDPYHPQLKTHKLSGKLADLWSFSVDYDLRVIFQFLNERRAVFVDIGTHKEVY